MGFTGWPISVFAFYEGLEADNSRSYWLAHKEIYERDVKAPFAALSEAVAKEFGPLHLFRPNRDTRFSKDKSPYKTQAAAVTEGPGGTHYYVAIGVDGLYAGSGYYMMMPDQLERFRAAVADNRKGAAFVRAVEQVRQAKLELASRNALKTAPRGYPKDHPRVEYLRWKGVHAGRQFPPARWISTAAALDRIRDTWRAAKPLNAWLDRHVGPSTEPPPEHD